MARDANPTTTGRRRQNSTASAGSQALTLQQRAKAAARGSQTAAAPVEPTSAHVSDPFLLDFLQPGFDPAAYWNATLGTRAAGSASSNNSNSNSIRGRASPSPASATATADQAAAAQACLSQLAAHTARLTTVLSQLTDDMLRSGSRMAYEVELLRGETIGLADVLEEVGQEFAPAGSGGRNLQTGNKYMIAGEGAGGGAGEEETSPLGGTSSGTDGVENEDDDPAAPPALAQLRMLAQVRSRLDAVIRTFGDAMEFVMPPSAMSVSASFLSVSGPETMSVGQDGGRSGRNSGERSRTGTTPGTTPGTTATSLEEKGQQVLKMRREEIARLLEAGSSDSSSNGSSQKEKGLEEAAARVAALRALCQVWAGTAEERARVKFVEGLQRMVDDRQKQLDRERQAAEQQAAAAAAAATAAAASSSPSSGEAGRGSMSTSKNASASQESSTTSASSSAAAAINRGYTSGYGLISQLQKIRGGL